MNMRNNLDKVILIDGEKEYQYLTGYTQKAPAQINPFSVIPETEFEETERLLIGEQNK